MSPFQEPMAHTEYSQQTEECCSGGYTRANPPNELSTGHELVEELARRIVDPLPAGERGAALGIDLGTASVVVVAVDARGYPLAGAMRDANVVRDGIVLDYMGAVNIVRELVAEVQQSFDQPILNASGAYPPGIASGDAAYVRHVVESCDLVVTELIEEPVAANLVLGMSDGAVVDVGGGTTGTAVFRDGELVHTADESTGGLHLSLVLAGGLGVGLAQAEVLKRDPEQQPRLMPIVIPVIEKIATVIAGHLRGHAVERVHLTGGTCAFAGFDTIIQDFLGIPVTVSENPMLVTPLGIARAAARIGDLT